MNKFYYYYNPVCAGANTPTAFDSDPYVAVIKNMFISELQQLVYYIEKLRAHDVNMAVYTDKVIEFISVLIVNLDFRKESFFVIFEDLFNNKIMLKKMYISACQKDNIEPDLLFDEPSETTSKDIILNILNDKNNNSFVNKKRCELTQNQKYLYEIIICLVLTACNSLIELQSYGANYEEGKNAVLEFLNNSNDLNLSEEKLKQKINDFSSFNYKIIKYIYNCISEKFGSASFVKVPIVKKEGKCILVSGNNLNELEKLLNALSGLNINVYTHNGMISAFLYDKFRNNPNLIGHYQYSENNYSIDYASFPGPIFICGNSTPKIDMIRGQIYTTAKYPAYGIGKIENEDYSPIIQYALDSKGFQYTSDKHFLEMGIEETDIQIIIQDIINKINSSELKHVIILASSEQICSNSEYFRDLISLCDESYYIVSFLFPFERKNFKYINTYNSFPIIYSIIENLKSNIPLIEDKISIFISECSKINISHLFNFKYLGINNLFLSHCCPNIINPALINALEKIYEIKTFDNPKEDIKAIKKKE